MSKLDCCVSGCPNQRLSFTKVKFYRIPPGRQANRRRLWLQTLQQVNGGVKELNGSARVCAAHFISGVASMDPDNPDFVPSVFTKQSPKKKGRRYFTGKRRRHYKTSMRTVNMNSPSKADSDPVEDQPSVLMDTNDALSQDMQTPPTSSAPKDETEATTIEPQPSSSNETPPLVKKSACIPDLNKIKPIVLLKRVVVPESGYWCELTNEDSAAESRRVKDKQLHEEETQLICKNCGLLFTTQVGHSQHCCAMNDEPSFPCNICDRSFTSSQHLKRHKLLHVKDVRKCSKCGVLFCRRHNHVMFHPIAVAVPETEEDSSEPENESCRVWKEMPASNLSPEKHNVSPVESNVLLEDNVQVINNVSCPVSYCKTLPKPPSPQLKDSLCPPYPHPPVHCPLVNESNLFEFEPPPPLCPDAFLKHPDLSTSLKIFSPQYLTSAFLRVKRNYDYILSKPVNVTRAIVKEGTCKMPIITPQKQNAKKIRKQRIAYDIEIEI